jgi:hypothetical protein
MLAWLGAGRAVGEGRKQFFFEKKNQKTFASLGRAYPERPKPKRTKVFCFFFSKKEVLAFPDLAILRHHPARWRTVRAHTGSGLMKRLKNQGGSP